MSDGCVEEKGEVRTTQVCRECLIVFSRYPEPGKTKTRTIPALGAEGAAELQRQMTEHTLAQVEKMQGNRAVEVHFSGGDRQQMAAWLGGDRVYRQQHPGNLGERLTAAFQGAFAARMTGVIAIGIDCPDLSAALLDEAFTALTESDVVLGPARDGGYYLIGMRRFVPALFQEIHWGTATVFEQTRAIAHQLNLTSRDLPILSDVDEPGDLAIWENCKARIDSSDG